MLPKQFRKLLPVTLLRSWLAGLIAYNLIRWTMACAAARAQVPLQTLSFSRAPELVVGWCLRWSARGPMVANSWDPGPKHAKSSLPRMRNARDIGRLRPRIASAKQEEVPIPNRDPHPVFWAFLSQPCRDWDSTRV